MRAAKAPRLLALACALLLSGCILPIPHQRLHAFGVKGRVLDERTHKPLANAAVAPVDRPQDRVFTDSTGAFTVQPVFGWHGAYCIGVVGVSLFPGLDVPPFDRNVSVSAKGYRSDSFTFQYHEMGPGRYIKAGDILLHKAK